MKIDADDTYSAEIDAFLKDKSKDALKAYAIDTYGDYDSLSIGSLISCAGGDFSHLFGTHFRNTWAQVYWCKGFGEYVQNLPDVLKNLTPPLDNAEQRASEGLLESTLAESLLVFARNYFGLHSFKDAESITIGEVLIAKKATYNDAIFQRKLSKIRMEEAKRNVK